MNNQSPQTPHYASFWLRFAATMIDNLLLGILLSPIFNLLSIPHPSFDPSGNQEIDIRALSVQIILCIVIDVFCWTRFGGTPGKIWLGMRVVDAKTLRYMQPTQALLRALAYWISFFPMGAGFFWIFTNPKRQTWHDLIAGSVVIKEPKPPKDKRKDKAQEKKEKPIQKDFIA